MEWLWNEGCKNMLESWVRTHHRTYPTQTSQTFHCRFPGTTPECNEHKFFGANHSRGSMVQFAQAKYIYCHQTLPRPTTFPPPCLKNNNSKEEATPATPMKSTSPTLPYINCIELIFRPNKWPAGSAGVACPSAFSTAPGRVPMEWLWNEGCKNMLESWVRTHHRTYPTQTSQTFHCRFSWNQTRMYSNENKFLGANHSRGSMVQFAQAKYIYCHQTLPRPTTFPPPCLKNSNSKEEATPATPMKSTSPTLPYINCIELIFRPNKWPAGSAGVACPSAFSTAPGRVPMEWLWNEGCKNMLESWVRTHHRTYPTQTSQTFHCRFSWNHTRMYSNENKFLGANHSRGSMVQFAQAKYIYCHQTLPRPTTFPPPCLKNNNSKEEATPFKGFYGSVCPGQIHLLPPNPSQAHNIPTALSQKQQLQRRSDTSYPNEIYFPNFTLHKLHWVDFQTKQMVCWFCRCCMSLCFFHCPWKSANGMAMKWRAQEYARILG